MKADEYVDSLKPTPYICCTHPRIVALSREITDSCQATNHCQKAIAIHDYVRDRIKFGFTTAFHEQTAIEVLDSGVGFCYTKGTLFQALLRAAGIPARPLFTDLTSDILFGVFYTAIPYVDHMITEVYLEGKWVKTDSYIVDEMLFTVARRMLQCELRTMGYGIHINGKIQWNGKDDQFVQLVLKPPLTAEATTEVSIIRDNFYRGYDDIKDFYEREKNAKTEMNVFVKSIAFPIVCMLSSRSLQRVRQCRFGAEVVK